MQRTDEALVRRVELERKLQADVMMSEERKLRHLQQLGRKESTFLRLRRTRLGLDDFRTVKVIGKGAFGEVSAYMGLYLVAFNAMMHT
jgi:protein-serine/threonine kinase